MPFYLHLFLPLRDGDTTKRGVCVLGDTPVTTPIAQQFHDKTNIAKSK